MTRSEATEKANQVINNVENVIIGKNHVIKQVVSALLSEGHILVEDVPGVGKTMLAKSIARSISGNFSRIQFTADLLPSDITGVNIFHQDTGKFDFRHGPVFTNVLLGDEINRATPRTQSSLLEAMEEKQVTVDGTRYDLQQPFLVIATQNPIELEGTYPLPFAQMDRFVVRVQIGYLSAEDEKKMISSRIDHMPLDDCHPIISCDELVNIQKMVKKVTIDDDLLEYIVSIVRQTRSSSHLEYGASPRGTLDLMRYSQASALIHDRDYVVPDDIKSGAAAVLAHRVIIKRGTRHGTLNASSLIDEIVESLEVPV